MKLHWKISAVLTVILLVVVSTVQFIQYQKSTSRLKDASSHDLVTLKDQFEESIEGTCLQIDAAVAGSLERGEMIKFKQCVEEQRQIKGLDEFSLVGAKGAIEYSSDPKSVGRPVDPQILAKLNSEKKEIRVSTPNALEIYRPHIVNGDCVRCHTAWTEGALGGANYFRFNTQDIRNIETQSQNSIVLAKKELITVSVLAACSVIGLLIVSTYMLIRKLITKPLDSFSPVLNQFAPGGDGDLSCRVDVAKRDEIGDLAGLLNGFLTQLENAVSKSQSIAGLVNQSTTTQAAAIEETSSSMTEMSSAVNSNAQNADKARQVIAESSRDVDVAHQAMVKLSDSVQQISNSSQRISEMTGAIQTIALKTNLLAINAAIEAARAGDAGAGFAVVAGEVRSLAKMSADCSREVDDLIHENVKAVTDAISEAKQAGEAFTRVVANSKNANQLIGEIATSSRQQASGIDQVCAALKQLDLETQNNSANADNLTQAMCVFHTSDQNQSN